MNKLKTKIRTTFSQNGRYGVILLEGPGRWTRMLKWDLKKDELIEGQWIHAPILNFSINSDASLILCFVQSYKPQHEYGTWVALSKPPWFTALALWQIGDSWGGGGSFLNDKKIYIRPTPSQHIFHGALPKGLTWTAELPKSGYSDLSGWKHEKEGSYTRYSKNPKNSPFEIESLDGKIKIYANKPQKTLLTLPLVPFHADIDPKGRLIFTSTEGMIYRGTLKANELQIEKLFDLSKMKPKPIKAPYPALIKKKKEE